MPLVGHWRRSLWKIEIGFRLAPGASDPVTVKVSSMNPRPCAHQEHS